MTRARPTTSRFTAVHLVRRQLAADRATLVLVAVVVVLVCAVLAAWPRAVSDLVGADLRAQVGTLTAGQRDPTLIGQWFPGYGPGTEPSIWNLEPGQDPLEAAHDGLASLPGTHAGATLRGALGEPELVVTREPEAIEKGPRSPDITAMGLAIRIDPVADERLRLTDGQAPAPMDPGALEDVGSDGEIDMPTMEVVLSVDTAEVMGWQIGEERSFASGYGPIRLTGTVEAIDPGADVWSHLESTLYPQVVEDGNFGTSVVGVAYVDPSALPYLYVGPGLVLTAWFPIDTAAVTGADRETLVRELRGFLAGTGLDSELEGALDAMEARQGTVTTILDVLAVGPVGVALAVLWLAGVLAVDRRRTALALASARGATTGDLRLVVAAQGIVVGVPAAAAGTAAAIALVPGPVRVGDLLAPALVGLAPAVLLALAAGRAPQGTRGRADDVGAGRGRARAWTEAAVVVLAALSVLAVLQRGITGGGAGTDPVLLACPVLVSLAACVLVLRVYPLPARAVARSLHRRRTLAPFLGAARGARTPAAGLAPMAALVLGVAVATFSGAVLSTVQTGAQENAARLAGADLRLDGRLFSAEDLDTVRAVAGVERIAPVGSAGRVAVVTGRSSRDLEIVTVDAAELAAVQAGLPGVEPLPPGLASTDAGALPAVVAARAKLDLDADVTAIVPPEATEVPVTALGEAASVAGVATGSAWMVVDRDTLHRVVEVDEATERVLVRVAPDADAATVAAAIEAELDTQLTVTTRAEVDAAVRGTVLVRGMGVGTVLVTALSVLLCTVVVVLALAVGGPARGRLYALLATLGAPARTGRRLVGWELVPWVTVAVVTGGVVGAVLPTLLLGGADLRPFTGGQEQPVVTADPLVLAGVAGAFVVTVVAAAAWADARARRVRPDIVLREGEGA